MRVVTVRDFRDRATEMMRRGELLLITRDGLPAGFFVPWDQPDLPDDVRKGVFRHLAELGRQELAAKGLTEEEVQRDFKASRRARR